MDKKKRKEMCDLIYRVFDALDPSGTNTQKYKNMFEPMSDAQFEKFFKNLFSNEDLYLILDIVEYEHSVKIDNIEKAANILGVPLMEKVACPFINGNSEEPVLTKEPVPVGYLHIKRMQQILSKKNTTSTEISNRSATTGQVINKDKNARESDLENFALVTLNADNCLKELNGPRADDLEMKTTMLSEIAKKGYVSLEELPSRLSNKTALNTISVYMYGMGIDSDLVTEGIVLPQTLKS